MTRDFSVRFWGVRGSTPTPGEDTLRYGGETTALEIRAGERLILIDCGSGARRFGQQLMAESLRSFDLLFTHTHLDHICGLPFFSPAYDKNFQIRCWAGHFPEPSGLQNVISRIMSPPIFPVAADTLNAVTFKEFKAGGALALGDDVSVRSIKLNHPGGACGYRVDFEGRALAVITDHEHGDAAIDAAIAAFVQGVDVMVYDSMYTDEELPRYIGWGHSTWQEATRLARRADVARPVLFHHDPCRTDDQLDVIGAAARGEHAGALVARQGMVLTL
ncbi:MBL fold metallo-hydrolase [Breoghania sp. L-A4]|uniref:MBL fold metallo-hydrolase n=1 Tax=Breoghania sp. L-A4 TaxID=2304600 RepID=UPI000E35AC93|nr:MBL fold metallo-hydrolase [Breoghania sp. L-A4]AXS40012.1 MBL fold metallo-hydrolase [Breoghania sp. L-A4]